MNKIKILHKTEPNTIELSKRLAELYDINSSKLVIRIGAWVGEMFVRINDELPEDTIGLPKELKQSFTLPEEIPYEIVVKNQSITIGPIIAFIAYRSKKNMFPQKLELFKRRFANYQKVKGLLFICAGNGIDPTAKTIEGYYYNPFGRTPETRWKYGVFPYPDAVYKRKPIKGSGYQDLCATIGDKIINSFFFLKADIVKMTMRDKEFRRYFPYSEVLVTEEQLSRFIKQYQFVYLKPSNGRQGIGIYKVTMDSHESYRFMDREKKTFSLEKGEQLNKFLTKCNRKNYIIQQGIESGAADQKVDFRVYAQKNKMGHWVCQGMIARLAKKDAVVTNLSFTEKLMPGLEAIKAIFHTDNTNAIKIQGKMYKQCIGVCEELDQKFGKYGDVAIDVIVDANKRVWILEINKEFGYRSLAKLKNRKLLRTLYTTPFDYAKTLAGF